jgi:hypothetical protein
MQKQFYVAPGMENISVECEQGVAQSMAPAGYGEEGAAGAAGTESGSTTW